MPYPRTPPIERYGRAEPRRRRSVRELVREEEERAGLDRAFDPYEPPTPYARPHHFAVNGDVVPFPGRRVVPVAPEPSPGELRLWLARVAEETFVRAGVTPEKVFDLFADGVTPEEMAEALLRG